MIKQLMNQLGYGFFAEVALLLFVVVFAAIVVRTLLTRKDISDRQAHIVLDENRENI